MTSQSKRNWTVIRLAIVATGVFQGFRLSPTTTSSETLSIWFVALISLVSMAILVVVFIMMSKENDYIDEYWHPPRWNINPFSFSQPFQLLHMIAYQGIVTGLVAISHWLSTGSPIIGAALLRIAFGIGILLGIQISMVLFKDRMLPHAEEGDDDLI